MVQWDDPTLEARLQGVSTDISFLLLGLYGWEYLTSLGVECAVIRGRLAFRWALIPYLVGRVFSFIFLLLLAIRTDPSGMGNVGCLPLTMVIAIAGDIGLGCASTNLMIRAWVIWKGCRFVHILLLLFALGHWVVLALDVADLQPTTQPDGTCAVTVGHPSVNAAVFLYSVCYDFVVLVLCILALPRQPSKSPLTKRLFAQGLEYFFVAFVTYISPAVFSLIDVPEITGAIALAASTIASCRAVRLLLTPDTSQSSETNEHELDVALTSQIRIQTIAASAC